jgi:hypothetical protein
MPSKNRNIKATVRIIQGNPTLLIILSIMIGRITPPRDEPETMIPNAAARCLKNQVISEDIQALKTALDAMDATMD